MGRSRVHPAQTTTNSPRRWKGWDLMAPPSSSRPGPLEATSACHVLLLPLPSPKGSETVLGTCALHLESKHGSAQGKHRRTPTDSKENQHWVLFHAQATQASLTHILTTRGINCSLSRAKLGQKNSWVCWARPPLGKSQDLNLSPDSACHMARGKSRHLPMPAAPSSPPLRGRGWCFILRLFLDR